VSRANVWIGDNWHKLEQAAKNVARGHQLWQDLLQHVLLDFLEKDKADEIAKDGYAQFYIVRMMITQWRSQTSPFYKQWKDTPQVSVEDSQLSEWYHVEDGEPDWNMEKIQLIMDHMEGDKEEAGWYHAKLIDLYAETPNYKRLSEMTGIPRNSISKSISRARVEIKKKYYK